MEGGTSRLVITRPGHHYRDAVRDYVIEVDGEDRGSIAAGETLAIEVPAGSRKVRASIDWTGSPAVVVDARPGEEVALLVEPAGSAFAALFQIFKPMSYLRLTVRGGGESAAPSPPTEVPPENEGDDWDGPYRRR